MTDRRDDPDVAAQWVARMDSDDWSDADDREMQAWIDADPLRSGLLLRTQACWLMANRQIMEQSASAEDGEQGHRWSRRKIMAGLAASAVAVGVVDRVRRQRRVEYATQVGEIRRVPLVDGSVVTINSESELAVHMGGAERRVELAHGEAWFDVAKDVHRPFVVAARKVRAQAVGTAFSVRVRDSGVEVLVNEGVVEAWSDGDSGQRARLTAGERMLISDDATLYREPEQPSSVDRALAWRSGMIDLEGETLGNAAEEFNRYNERKIIVADPRVAAEQIDGVFRVNDPEGFASALRDSLGVVVHLDNPGTIRIER